MKKSSLILSSLFLGTSFLLYNCTKDKTKTPIPTNFITAECPDTIKFSSQILDSIDAKCFSCHANGQSPEFSDYQSIQANAEDILNTLDANANKPMPQGGASQFKSPFIQQFKCWISQGKQNN